MDGRSAGLAYYCEKRGEAMTKDNKNKYGGLSGFIRNHTEAFVSLAALVTAVAAVVITLEQTKVMREEAELERRNARISVMPSVWVATHIGDTEEGAYYKVVLTNKGLGPAVLENFEVTYKGESVGNWDELARRMAANVESTKSFENDTLASSRSPVSPGLMLEAGGVAEPLGVFQATEAEGLRVLLRSGQDVGIKLCYCSLYGDCFETQLFRRPLEVEACEAADEPFISHGFFRN